ncbi:hypothetical protein ACMZ6Z_00905 [Streptococcus pluranimalium]|uniref:hypothetical protein n=1 Tax=Streptococcus pluranimalium TaxID=82348 RepID=UPI0039FD8224
MSDVMIIKKCTYDDNFYKSTNHLEKIFEQYIEKKVKKIIDTPDKYSFLDIRNGDKYES